GIAELRANKRDNATDILNASDAQLRSVEEGVLPIEEQSQTCTTNIDTPAEQQLPALAAIKSTSETRIIPSQAKIDSIEIQENFDFELLAETLKELEVSISTISKTKDEQLLELRKKLSSLTTLVKGAIGLEILQSATIKDKLQEVKDKETELKEKR